MSPLATYIKGTTSRLTNERLNELWNPNIAECVRLSREPIGGWRYVLVFVKSDLETRCVNWGMPSYNSYEMCADCLAHRGPERPSTDLRAGAAWRSTTIKDNSAFVARHHQPRHPLFTSPFAWRFFAPLDAMHILDCNGAMSIVVWVGTASTHPRWSPRTECRNSACHTES